MNKIYQVFLKEKMVTAKKHKSKFSTLLLGAIGVVFGDIGTSPLYAIRESLRIQHLSVLTPQDIFSILSLIFWTLVIVVSIKYVSVIMNADNEGEGGSFALIALINKLINKSDIAKKASILGLCGAAFFYGDCMLTPAISVLSAVEGIKIIEPLSEHYVIPITLIILTLLFAIQRHGTGLVGRLFGPIVIIWFLTIAYLGVVEINNAPEVLLAIHPKFIYQLFWHHPLHVLLIMSSVFLAVTGAEALYADMGHFGKKPIRMGWFMLVFPALVLNYFGQGALLLNHPEAIENPFFLLASPEWLPFLVILATLATIIASQSVISGAFSVFRQAVQLDYLPRSTAKHTSGLEEGQIYVPIINWTLFIAAIGLVLFFQNSSHLANAYGISVAGTMAITTSLVALVMRYKWDWPLWQVALVAGPLLLVDFLFLAANSLKIFNGGWFSLLASAISFMILLTWKKGRTLVLEQISKQGCSLKDFIGTLGPEVLRPEGTAIILTGNTLKVPLSLLQYTRLAKSLHSQVILVTVLTENVPSVPKKQRIQVTSYSKGFNWVIIKYGFMQTPHVPRALEQCENFDLHFDLIQASYFLSRSIIIPTQKVKMANWRKHIFAVLSRNATNATDFFHLPSNQSVELGIRMEI